ncbi:AI-2E family transporter [uncultured Gammaproteobacteria bacterium]
MTNPTPTATPLFPAEASHRRRVRFWLGLGVAALATLWLLSAVLLPFVAAMIIAYFLDPVVDRLQRTALTRGAAAALVLLSFLLLLVVGLVLLVPLVGTQVDQFVRALPHYAEVVRGRLLPLIERLSEALPADDWARLRTVATDYAGTVAGWLASVPAALVRGGLALFDVFSLLVVTPVVAFYLLRDWDDLIAHIDGWLPRAQAPTIRRLAVEIDHILSGFLRGQATVCLFLALYYAVGLSLAGLHFGLMIGLLTGVLSFMPYVGSLLGLGTGLILALIQGAGYDLALWVLAVFALGQIIEGYVLTPRLVGERIGLHPVWVMFALLVGVGLAGFAGVLVAVPVAAVVGVLARFAVGRYLDSELYRGNVEADSTQ